jgi:hypothetical protein
LAHVKDELALDAERVGEYVQELSDLGVISQSETEGLVDFPSVMDGRLVFLCWKLGEPEVMHWHELDAGFAGRQTLAVESIGPGTGDGAEDAYGC